MNRNNAGRAAVDRLIALASDDEKPVAAAVPAPDPEATPAEAAEPTAVAEAPEENKTLETVPYVPDASLQELEQSPMWKALLQFRVLIPYVSRILGEMNDRADPSTAATVEIRHSLVELHAAHRELRMTAQDQVLQMKRLEEELKRSREAAERNALDSSELVEDVKSMRLLVRITIGAVGGVGVVLIALMIYVLIRLPH